MVLGVLCVWKSCLCLPTCQTINSCHLGTEHCRAYAYSRKKKKTYLSHQGPVNECSLARAVRPGTQDFLRVFIIVLLCLLVFFWIQIVY